MMSSSFPSIFVVSSLATASVRFHPEVVAPVLRPAAFLVLAAERLLLAVADGADPVGADPQLHQFSLHRIGTVVAQRQVVFLGSAVVAVAFNHDRKVRVLVEK